MAKVAAGVASLLSLPKSAIDKEFANNHLYLSSFTLTQPDIFNAILRVTGMSEDEWQVEKRTTQSLIDEGRQMVEAGHPAGHFKLIIGSVYRSGDYSDHVHNGRLHLEEEDLDTVVKAAVEDVRPGGFAVGNTLALK